MKQDPLTYVLDYIRDMQGRRRDPAPRVPVATPQNIVAIPVAVLALPGPEVAEILHYDPQANPVAQHASPFELTLALVCEEQSMKRARQLAGFHMYNPYPHTRQTSTRELADLLGKIDAQCSGAHRILINIGTRLSQAQGTLASAQLAAQVVNNFQDILQEQD